MDIKRLAYDMSKDYMRGIGASVRCETCRGTGKVALVAYDEALSPCEACGGTGDEPLRRLTQFEVYDRRNPTRPLYRSSFLTMAEAYSILHDGEDGKQLAIREVF